MYIAFFLKQYNEHKNVTSMRKFDILSCRSTAGYADTATFEGHGLPLERGRSGFKVCVYSDRLCIRYSMAVQKCFEKLLTLFCQKRIFLHY